MIISPTRLRWLKVLKETQSGSKERASHHIFPTCRYQMLSLAPFVHAGCRGVANGANRPRKAKNAQIERRGILLSTHTICEWPEPLVLSA